MTTTKSYKTPPALATGKLIFEPFLSILSENLLTQTMNVVKPPRLRRGDLIGIVAPGSPAAPEKLTKGVRYLEQLGYRVVVGKNIERRRGYLAGTDKQRAEDLNAMFADRRVKAIFTVRGGYGVHRILHLVDYTTVRRNPKIVVGYSDVTALHLALFAKTRLVTFLGPMVATEFGRGFGGPAEDLFWRIITSPKPPGFIKNPGGRKLTVLRRGATTGRLLGGNLSLVAALLGTPFFPDVHRYILALEEVEEPPYKIDRMFHHLRLSGMLSRKNGFIIGDIATTPPTRGKASLTLRQILADVFSSAESPCMAGFHFGHVRGSLTLPLGVIARLTTGRKTLEIRESAVQ